MSSTGSTSQTRRTPTAPVAEGDVVGGKYRVERLLAGGGMGVIVVARHLVLDQPVALKFLIPHVHDEGLVARFLREARSSARIQNEHVIRVFDCGSIGEDVPWMAMELLEGHDLAHELRERRAMPVTEAVDIVLEALEGVAAAHAMGIVHRDLKPSNIFLAEGSGRARTVKVLDFGISKPLSGPDTPVDDVLTGTAIMLGSPRYASPEQAQCSRDVDPRTDVWSMGVVLYELLDGRCPFAGGTMGEILGRVLLHKPPPLSATRGDVPADLDAILARCLMREREDRWPDVAALARALVPHASPGTAVHADRIATILGLDGGTVSLRGATRPGAAIVPPVAAPARPRFDPRARARLPSDAELTDVRPAPPRRDAATVPELPSPHPELPSPHPELPPPHPSGGASRPLTAAATSSLDASIETVGESTVGTFARSGTARRSRTGPILGVVSAVAALSGVAFAIFSLSPAATKPAAAPAAQPAAPSAPVSRPVVSPAGVPRPVEAAPSASSSAAVAPSASAPAPAARPPAPSPPPRGGPAARPPSPGVLDRSD